MYKNIGKVRQMRKKEVKYGMKMNGAIFYEHRKMTK